MMEGIKQPNQEKIRTPGEKETYFSKGGLTWTVPLYKILETILKEDEGRESTK